jgi:membrane protein implicated in regulation of membrane protease activity
LYSEETEIQIRLAELQANIQVYLAIAVGFFAAVFGLAAILYQVLLAYTASNELYLLVSIVAILILEFFCAYYTNLFVKKMTKSRNEIEKLKAKYVWQF